MVQRFNSHITHHRHQFLLRLCTVFTLLGRLFRFMETMVILFDLTDQMTVMCVT